MGNLDIDHYCRVYDDVIPSEICDTYIRFYEETLMLDAAKHRRLSNA